MILWCKGGFMYQFGAGISKNAEKQELAEIESILQSVKFLD
jgi:hypothetical protein